MGGTVAVTSEGQDKGASFTPRLPAVVPETDTIDTGEGDNPKNEFPRLNGLRILVVDDEPDTRDLLKIAFENHGVAVDCARLGKRTPQQGAPNGLN